MQHDNAAVVNNAAFDGAATYDVAVDGVPIDNLIADNCGNLMMVLVRNNNKLTFDNAVFQTLPSLGLCSRVFSGPCSGARDNLPFSFQFDDDSVEYAAFDCAELHIVEFRPRGNFLPPPDLPLCAALDNLIINIFDKATASFQSYHVA